MFKSNKNIKVISENASKENIAFYYIDEKSNLSTEDISLIDSEFKVEYIPAIVSIKKKNKLRFLITKN